MIDFDKGVKRFSDYGGSERKGAVEYDGCLYMIKFPDRARAKKTVLSYINNQYSEHLGCQIFRLCDFETQETELGHYTDYKGERKLVVGCKDFTQDGSRLYEFARLGKIIIGSDKNMGTALESVDEIIDNHELIKDKEEIRAQFWDMFIIDALLGNKNRHLGNWGLLVKDNVVKFAPIYDCGSTLSSLMDDSDMAVRLETPEDFKNKEFNIMSCYRENGKRIVYHEIFKNSPKNLKEAIMRVVPKIDIQKICELVDTIETMSEVRKQYLQKALLLRYTEIIKPAWDKLLK